MLNSIAFRSLTIRKYERKKFISTISVNASAVNFNLLHISSLRHHLALFFFYISQHATDDEHLCNLYENECLLIDSIDSRESTDWKNLNCIGSCRTASKLKTRKPIKPPTQGKNDFFSKHTLLIFTDQFWR